jgi:5'-nucleotidase
MRTKLGTAVAAALLISASANASVQGDAGHSLEADQHDERIEGVQARSKAMERVRWHDPSGHLDPSIAVKLLGINDFHGQLSPRTLGPPTALRPVGGSGLL